METTTTDEDLLSMPVEVAGLTFRNPLLVGSGPTAGTVEQLERACEAGWAGASIKLTFDPPPYISLPPRYCYEAEQGYLFFTAEKRLDLDQGLELVRQAKKRLPSHFILLANFSYTGEKGVPGWADMARAFEDAGVDAYITKPFTPENSTSAALTCPSTSSAPPAK